MSEVPVEQLFEAMKNRANDEQRASLAWAEFFQRYKGYLWKSCLNHCKTLLEGKEVAKDLFQTTMQKIYLKASLFSVDKNTGIKSWISTIAYNEFQDYLKKYHLHFTNEFPDDTRSNASDEENDEIEEELADKISDLKFDQLKILLSHLNAKEYKVLITYMSHFQIDRPNLHLPDPIMKQLCYEFKVEAAAIRQIKRRALLKLKKLAGTL